METIYLANNNGNPLLVTFTQKQDIGQLRLILRQKCLEYSVQTYNSGVVDKKQVVDTANMFYQWVIKKEESF
jgi:hypothetical protein